MRRPGGRRLDYAPGPAARAALDAAAAKWPDLSQQALIDLLLINGESALSHEHWRPTELLGRNRQKWRARRDR